MIATVALYLWWAGAPVLRWSHAAPKGLYSEQADAFLAGQLYLKVQPNPALLRLTDPYDPRQFAPYHLIDLSFYRGHYYLYFGVAPVVTLFLPWQALTGMCLADEEGAALFTIAGFVLSVLLLRSLRRRYFAAAPPWAFLIASSVLALGNLSLLLLRQPNFPQIPIASAWTWQIAALAAVYCALHARRPWPWLALASGACGLAVASRPTFLLGCLLLIPAVLRLAGTPWSVPAPRARAVPTLLAAILPIAAVGVGLMIYNAVRFDSPFEFGMRYQLAGGDLRHQVLLSPRYFPANVWSYLFSTPEFTRYFPFIEDQLRPLGVLAVFPFTWLAGLVPVGVRAQAPAARPILRTFALSAILAFAGNFALLSLYYSNWPRYQLDFFLALSWFAALGLIAAAHAWAGHRWRIRLLAAVAALLAGVNICLGFCFAARSYHSPQKLAALARLAMRPVGWFEAAGHTRFGPLHLAVTFPADRTVRLEPLLCTGTAGGELVYVRYLDQNYVQLGLFHAGLGYFDGEPVIPLPRAWHAVDIDLGSLYPPPNHPQFDGWTPEEILRVRTRLTLTLDGQTVLARDFMAHAGTPADIRIGERPADLTIGEPHFAGRITVTGRGPLAPVAPWFMPSATGGAVLTLQFGPRRTGYSEPLVCSGQARDGDVLFVTYVDPSHVRFGVDSWTRGVIRTESIEVPDGPQPHRLGVWMPPLARSSPADGGGAPATSGRLTITWDDRLLWDGPCPFHAASPASVYFGINPIGASSTEPTFAGQFVSIHPTAPEIRSECEEVPPNAPVSLLLQFPPAAAAGSEPLVVTGRTGAGDFVYVRYVGDNKVRFGFDHWGVGGALGDPVAIDPAAAHRVEITMGSLYSGARSGPATRRVEVKLDGQTVLAADSPCHPTHPREWYIGENPIGGSTCGERFTGRLLLVERGAAP
jgi:hypothetical protein